jgi:hypothetical protein
MKGRAPSEMSKSGIMALVLTYGKLSNAYGEPMHPVGKVSELAHVLKRVGESADVPVMDTAIYTAIM